MSIFRAIGPQRNEGLNLLTLGDALRGMGQLERALVHIQQGLDIATGIGAVGLEAIALQSLAKIYYQLGCSNDAIDYLQRAALLHRTEHSDRLYAEALIELGAILNDTGAPDQAREAWHKAVTILTDLDPARAAQIGAQLDALPAC